MGTIINFPTKESAGYRNMKMLFDVVDSVETCNFYLESVEQLYEDGHITETERLTLRRIGRQKRLRLANPPQKQQKASKPGVYLYTPEMGQEKPEGCRIEAGLAYDGKHYFLDTPLHLKGRGISFLKTYTSKELTPSGQYRVGWNEYMATKKAFEKLKEQYTISYKSCLD